MRGNITRRGTHSWRLKFDVPGDGKRVTRYVTFRGTRQSAEAELARIINDAHRGSLIDPSKLTVEAWLRRWLNDAKPDLSVGTVENYTDKIERRIIPVLGTLLLQKLKPADVRRWFVDMPTASSLSTRARKDTFRLLSAALDAAVRDEVLYRNVCDAVKLPKTKKAKVETLKEHQLDLAPLAGHWVHPIAALALLSGARRGELLALRWADLDLDAGTMRIERSLEQTRAGLAFKEPKTPDSVRVISLPPVAVEVLRAHRIRRLEQRIQLGLGGKPELVFTTLEGKPIAPDVLSKAWSRQTAKAGMPQVHFHALRHTHASMLLAEGIDIVQVSKRLGHASPTVTLSTYSTYSRKTTRTWWPQSRGG